MSDTTHIPGHTPVMTARGTNCNVNFHRLRRFIRNDINSDVSPSSVDVRMLRTISERFNLDVNSMLVLCASDTAYKFVVDCTTSFKYKMFFTHVIDRLKDDVIIEKGIINKYADNF